MTNEELLQDILEGKLAIARVVRGENATAKQADSLIKNGIPHQKVGNRYYALKSRIYDWMRK